MRCEASFKIAGWDEKTFSEPGHPGPGHAGKLTKASVKKAYSGDLEGEGILEYLLSYKDDGSAEYMGYERVTGKLDGVQGSFVFRHQGTYSNDRMVQTSSIVEGSGTGGLIGISGKTEILAGHDRDYPFTLEYEMAMAEVPIWGS
jgi:hypothetical protein